MTSFALHVLLHVNMKTSHHVQGRVISVERVFGWVYMYFCSLFGCKYAITCEYL